MAKKTVDPIKAKQKKQKILAAVLGVLFLGVMAFQVPRVMKMMKTEPPPVYAQTTTTPTAGTPSLAAPTLAGAEQPASVGGATPTPGMPVVQDGQLASFSRFASKDPFAQQLSEDGPGSSSSGSSSGSSGSSGSGTEDPGIPDIPGNTPAPGGAVISVNGTLYSVSVDTDFPTASETDPTVVPLFHLVSATAHTAKVSIVGGSYSNGSRTVTLRENKPVTLMNTADGTRYTLVLKPQGTSAEGESGSGSGSGGSSTTPPTTVTLPPTTP
jgi:uncharacterized membrane protein YgcG